MKSIRHILIGCAAIALSASVAMAQDGGGAPNAPGHWGSGRDGHPGGRMEGHHMRHGGMRRGGMHHRRMHDPVARLLGHQTLLHLTPAQVNSIISIDDKLHSDNKPLVQQLMGMRMRGGGRDGRSVGGGDNGGHAPPSPGQRDSVMTIMRTMRENVWRATAAADAVLTPEQLTTAGSLDPAGHMGMMFRRPEMGPGGRGNGSKGE
jgi:hypothetical protein